MDLPENIWDQLSLAGRTAVITGGGQGLGKAMAIALAQAGADVVIFARHIETALETQERIQAEGVRCTVIQGDVRVEADNAGIWLGDDAEKMTTEDWREVIDVNLTGQFIMSREVGRVMIEQGRGSIINIASMSGVIVNTPQNQCAYNASKGGLIMLTKSMAAEWAPRGVRVNALCPGYMRTEMSEDRYQRQDPAIERWFSMTPMGRSGRPEELMGIAVYLASDASSFMTGAVILVDGGYTAW
jgi:NAD(P)-dependent dehydrogenase (short-subunit alcohol dehydrogenase family)